MTRREGGFTIVEVLVAIIVLTVGVLALAGTSAMVTRMLGEGKHATAAVQVATRRVETLRQLATNSATGCANAGFANGGPVTSVGVSERWTIAPTVPASQGRIVQVIYSYPTSRGLSWDTLRTIMTCK